MRKFAASYWPIIAILPVTAVISIVVDLVGDPWKAGDWGSNVALALLITFATIILSRRQARLQENTADLELDEKIAVLSGSLHHLRTDLTASRACQIMNDGKAGLNLVGSGHPDARDEYLDTLIRALLEVQTIISQDLHCQTVWSDEDWQSVNLTLRTTLTPLQRRPSRGKGLDPSRTAELRRLIDVLIDRTGGDQIPFEVFRSHYQERDIRCLLDWEGLTTLTGASSKGDASTPRVTVERHEYARVHSIPFDRLYSPWYLKSDGSPGDYSDPTSSPLRIDVFPEHRNRMSMERGNRIMSILADMDHATRDNPYFFAVATLALPTGDSIVLDGNHRLCAASSTLKRHGGAVQHVHVVEFRLRVDGLTETTLPDARWHLRRAEQTTPEHVP